MDNRTNGEIGIRTDHDLYLASFLCYFPFCAYYDLCRLYCVHITDGCPRGRNGCMLGWKPGVMSISVHNDRNFDVVFRYFLASVRSDP